MTTFDAASAIAAWKKALGEDVVVDDAEGTALYSRSACGSDRTVTAVLKPESSGQVRQIVDIAIEHRIPLYPVSCGRQWGMGSRLPVRDGAVIVDLSGMNRILEVNPDYHYAVVEPGVTQRQLCDYIKEHQLPLMLNVTGSTSDTSLIGNALDRGVGYFDCRAHGISSMEVVLGNGETIRTGFGHYENARTKYLYHYGVGPSLDGLFLQGSFGIVTSACIDLMPCPEAHMAAIIRIDREELLPRLIDGLAALRSRGIFTTIAHVGNRERSYITLAPLLYEQMIAGGEPPGETTRRKAVELLEEGGFGPWSAAIGVLGTKGHLRMARKEIRKTLGGFAKVMFLTDALLDGAKAVAERLSFLPGMRKQLMMLRAVEPVYGYTRGDTSDQSLKSVYWASGDYDHLNAPDPDQSDSGLLFCLPILPARGDEVLSVVKEIRDLFSRSGFEAAITVNLMDMRCMEGVVSLSFDRRDAGQAGKARACIQTMEARFMELGYPPYRVGINSMHHVVREDDPFWQTVRQLKNALDPHHIIAPGRYSLD